MQRTYVQDTINSVGKTVLLKGWVNIRRDHGKLIFIDLRDKTGLIQIVINPKVSSEAHSSAQEIRNEYVLEIEGLIKERDQKQINPDLPTGKIELEVTKLPKLCLSK
jgi:aspartyl-tRNA synthetase